MHSVAGLACEMVWIKILETHLGMSTAALATVLATFIGGLGIGGLSIAALTRHNSVSLRKSVIAAELGAAAWIAALPFTLPLVEKFYLQFAPPVESAGHLVIRLLTAMILLIPPAALFGSVFPLLGELAEQSRSGVSQASVSRLYRDGLIWSALGAAVFPAIILRSFGLAASNHLIAILCVTTAAAAFAWIPEDAKSRPLRLSSTQTASLIPTRGLWVIGAVLGAILFGSELIGAKYLWLLVQDTFYGNGILVGIVLMLMGVGALAFQKAAGSRRSTVDHAAWVSGSLLLFAVSLVLWIIFPYPIACVGKSLAVWPPEVSGAVRFFMSTTAILFLVLGIPSLCSGWAFYGLCEWALQQADSSIDPIGRLTGWNYLGSMLGSLATNFILLPVLGVTRTLAGLALIACFAAAWLAAAASHSSLERMRQRLLFGLLLVLCFWIGKSGDVTFAARAASPNRVLLHTEDATGIVEVYADPYTGDRMLFSNRLHMEGSNSPSDVIVKTYQGALPTLLHPAPRDVLVIGLGTGMSLAHNLAPEVLRLTCVEYSRGIVRAAHAFDADNKNVLANPKVHLINQDGRNFLRLSRDRYDLIIQDLFFPYQTGVGNLYSFDHFLQIKTHLLPGGAFCTMDSSASGRPRRIAFHHKDLSIRFSINDVMA